MMESDGESQDSDRLEARAEDEGGGVAERKEEMINLAVRVNSGGKEFVIESPARVRTALSRLSVSTGVPVWPKKVCIYSRYGCLQPFLCFFYLKKKIIIIKNKVLPLLKRHIYTIRRTSCPRWLLRKQPHLGQQQKKIASQNSPQLEKSFYVSFLTTDKLSLSRSTIQRPTVLTDSLSQFLVQRKGPTSHSCYQLTRLSLSHALKAISVLGSKNKAASNHRETNTMFKNLLANCRLLTSNSNLTQVPGAAALCNTAAHGPTLPSLTKPLCERPRRVARGLLLNLQPWPGNFGFLWLFQAFRRSSHYSSRSRQPIRAPSARLRSRESCLGGSFLFENIPPLCNLVREPQDFLHQAEAFMYQELPGIIERNTDTTRAFGMKLGQKRWNLYYTVGQKLVWRVSGAKAWRKKIPHQNGPRFHTKSGGLGASPSFRGSTAQTGSLRQPSSPGPPIEGCDINFPTVILFLNIHKEWSFLSILDAHNPDLLSLSMDCFPIHLINQRPLNSTSTMKSFFFFLPTTNIQGPGPHQSQNTSKFCIFVTQSMTNKTIKDRLTGEIASQWILFQYSTHKETDVCFRRGKLSFCGCQQLRSSYRHCGAYIGEAVAAGLSSNHSKQRKVSSGLLSG
ncbi:hypothetical protein VP01_700g3 [Puccinia sorghi]|uniref:Uncharacterized protein n=1 Tax=Puccinia sorghi TaxID=27349 RepID=A0A0L6UDT5_9BASI|nr:hypothetical protein VP01_700g3 [Puccinia sorghi]